MKTEVHKLSRLFALWALFIIAIPFSMNAQVTIGSNTPPVDGAILDLKEEQTSEGGPNSTRGLGLPRVKITEKYSLKDVIEGFDSLDDEDKKELSASHIGLVVYSMNDFTYDQCSFLQSGVMVWTGENGWQNMLKYSGEHQGDIATRQADSLILVKIYDATDGDNWPTSYKTNWKTDKPLHEWARVTVETNTDGTPKLCGRVTELNLLASSMKNTIPNEIWDLSELKVLIIGHPNRAASIDINNIHQLKKLEKFNLSGPTITGGQIPASIGELTNLRNLSIVDCSSSLAGSSIPEELSNLINMEYLSLYSNKLSGPIPSGLPDLTNLTHLRLDRNELTGPIPEDIGNLALLTTLYLEYNKLSGNIPSSIGKLTKLTHLYLKNNELTGEIPAEIGNMTNLGVIDLIKNNLTSISPQLGVNAASNATEIYWLQADSNKITNLPKELALMPKLRMINLSVNAISQDIPVEIAEINTLESLNLRENRVTGSIPAGFGALPKFRSLDLSYNQLTGGIPTELGNCQNLTQLRLSRNFALGGQLPASLGSLPKIQYLELAGCDLTGTIPESYANLTGLYYLRLDANKLEGSLPTFPVDFPNLTSLRLSHNKFTGEIPAIYNDLKRINTASFELTLQLNYLSGGNVPPNVINLINRQPSESQATAKNPIRARICPQYNTDGSVNEKPFNNFDACMPKP